MTWKLSSAPLAMLLVVSIASTAHCSDPPAQLARWLQPQTWQKDIEGPVVSLGGAGEFDDMHIFAPAVAIENGRYTLYYSGSRGRPNQRVFRLGLAVGSDGRHFEKHRHNPILEFSDGSRSVLTPALLRRGDGTIEREQGKLRMWFTAAALGKSRLHTLHESRSVDGLEWDDPSPPLVEHCYCPTILKTDRYEMWYADVSRRPWVIRHAESADGTHWQVDDRPALRLSQDWEAEIVVYPTVLKIDDVYLMWYGSYDRAIRRETTAIGFAASLDGRKWYKHPQNPVLRPDPDREWESNYVGSGCVTRLADGSFRYWYAGRKRPPFDNLYFPINTARWNGPASMSRNSGETQ
jgi:predicted GH43/DUF377 family glycosyl hydrolase